jgi:hypothetical protein
VSTQRPEGTVRSALDVVSGVPSVDVNHRTSHLLMRSRDRSTVRPLRVDRDSTTEAFRGPAPNRHTCCDPPYRTILPSCLGMPTRRTSKMAGGRGRVARSTGGRRSRSRPGRHAVGHGRSSVTPVCRRRPPPEVEERPVADHVDPASRPRAQTSWTASSPCTSSPGCRSRAAGLLRAGPGRAEIVVSVEQPRVTRRRRAGPRSAGPVRGAYWRPFEGRRSWRAGCCFPCTSWWPSRCGRPASRSSAWGAGTAGCDSGRRRTGAGRDRHRVVRRAAPPSAHLG